jgi:hypothetical protein
MEGDYECCLLSVRRWKAHRLAYQGASRVFPCSHGAKVILRSENLLRGKPELAVGFYFWDALLYGD